MQKYLIGIIIILIIIIIYIHNYNYYINNYKSHSIPLKKSINNNFCSAKSSNNFCSAKSSCTAKDPVNDPKYNMKQVIIQTLLLEEHLADKNKYCKPCIVKQDTDCIDGGTDNLVDKLEEEKDINYWLIVALIAGIIIVFAFIIASLTQSSNYKKIINDYNRQLDRQDRQQSQIIK